MNMALPKNQKTGVE